MNQRRIQGPEASGIRYRGVGKEQRNQVRAGLRRVQWALIALIVLLALAACQSRQPAAELVPAAFGDAEKQAFTDSMKAAELKTLYVPQQIAKDDKLNQVQTSGADKTMTLTFLKMELIESPQELKPAGEAGEAKEVKLANGTARWMADGGKQTLYMKLGDTYIALRSLDGSLAEGDIEAIAATLAPLQ